MDSGGIEPPILSIQVKALILHSSPRIRHATRPRALSNNYFLRKVIKGLDVNSTFLMQNSVCFGMQQKDIPEEIREVVGGMRRDFRFAPELKTSLLGRTIEEIEKSKIFPVKGFCPEQVVVGASRFQKKGFPSYVRVYRRFKIEKQNRLYGALFGGHMHPY